MLEAALESLADAFRAMFDPAATEGVEGPADVVEELGPAERVVGWPLAEWEAGQELDKNILGCLQSKGGCNQEALPRAADRQPGIVLAGADLRAGAAGTATRCRDFEALRLCCLGYDESDNCDLCLHAEAALEPYNTPVGVVAVAGMPARLLGSSQELEALGIFEVVAAGNSCAASPRLLHRVCSIAEG